MWAMGGAHIIASATTIPHGYLSCKGTFELIEGKSAFKELGSVKDFSPFHLKSRPGFVSFPLLFGS